MYVFMYISKNNNTSYLKEVIKALQTALAIWPSLPPHSVVDQFFAQEEFALAVPDEFPAPFEADPLVEQLAPRALGVLYLVEVVVQELGRANLLGEGHAEQRKHGLAALQHHGQLPAAYALIGLLSGGGNVNNSIIGEGGRDFYVWEERISRQVLLWGD